MSRSRRSHPSTLRQRGVFLSHNRDPQLEPENTPLTQGARSLPWMAAVVLVLVALPAAAHEVRPAYLELSEIGDGVFRVLWKVPTQGEMGLPLVPSFPAGCAPTSEGNIVRTASFVAERWTMLCSEGVIGGKIGIENLEITLTDVLVRLDFLDSGAQTARLRPNSPTFVVPAEPSLLEVAHSYLLLGIEHILFGIDHLLFVFALLMIVEGKRKLIYTVTAFTVSHSITLALATLGLVHVPGAPVEAVIALSILFLATEIVHGRRGRPTLTHSRPWLVAFAFGLLHGFGFAGALSEVGLPESAIPVALLLFNVGVEVGQVLFIAAALATWGLVMRLPVRWPENAWAVPTYGIGIVAAYWTIERIVAF